MYHFPLLINIILPPCFWDRTWNMVKPSSLCQGCAIVVSWRKRTNWPHYVKISICKHLADTGRLWQLNSLNNPFLLKELVAPTVPQNEWAGCSGETESWRRLLPANSVGGVGLLSPCWEPLLYVLALSCMHPGWKQPCQVTEATRKVRCCRGWRMKGGKEDGYRAWKGKW